MIGKLACNAARKFIKNPDCCYDQFEIYQYGFFILFSNLIFFILTIILGAVLDVFFQSIVFFCCFFFNKTICRRLSRSNGNQMRDIVNAFNIPLFGRSKAV